MDEIESCLAAHPELTACAVVSSGSDGNTTITAFVVARDAPLCPTDLSQFCYNRLARYMVPDQFRYLPDLPRTSTGKTHYQLLERQCDAKQA
ncbi:hypothetical protein KPG66_16740 [Mycetohabitans sp. B2]|uniref:AMP-binding enzyme n=1 Tax=Mycetohabitans sp. B2 TaxID=2841274 RepID=UPI001F2BF37C|nr:hypothetical protein [Mycetohabitans sp. B2]MCF7697617.1 hypothetical protein [Mycetohabitans sp. B2]